MARDRSFVFLYQLKKYNSNVSDSNYSDMDKAVHKQLSFKITGLLYKTHSTLGRLRNEKQYADYFEGLLKEEKLNYKRELKFKDDFGKNIARCVCDFLIEDKIIPEFKAKNFITKEDYYQTRRYLSSLNKQLGVLVNFRQYRLAPKRVLNSDFLHLKH